MLSQQTPDPEVSSEKATEPLKTPTFATQIATSSSIIQASGEKFLVVFFVILTVFGLPHASSTILCNYILTAHLSLLKTGKLASVTPDPIMFSSASFQNKPASRLPKYFTDV